MVFSLTVSSHIMIAHSFKGKFFGPAQALHGATYAIQATFRADTLDPHGVVVDIGQAAALLESVLTPINYQNLDLLPRFAGRNTTTEVMAHAIFDDLRLAIRNGSLGDETRYRLRKLQITLHESPTAWASYEGTLLDA